MPRVYSNSLQFPHVNPLDWTLLAKIDQLFRPYRAANDDFYIEAYDRHGAYREEDLAKFRTEVESQDEVPSGVMLSLRRLDEEEPDLHLLIYMVENLRSAQIKSTNQATVDHVSARLEDLFERTYQRQIAEERKQEKQAREASPPVTTVAKASRLRAFVYDPWTLAVGSALVVAAILAGIAWAAGWLF